MSQPRNLSPICTSVPLDNRLYLTIKIFDHPVISLFDSGASSTVIGASGLDFLKSKDIPYDISPVDLKVFTADGISQQCDGKTCLPITLNGITKFIDCLVVPAVTHTFILGIDFGISFGLKVDLRNKIFETLSPLVSSNDEVHLVSVTSGPSIHDLLSLKEDQKKRLECAISKFHELVSSKLGRTTLYEHYIDTGDATPVKQRQYLLSPAMQIHLHREVDDMLRLGVIRESNSAWSSPILLVKKKNGELRACYDARRLNLVTVRDSYPLPRTDAILNRLRDARYLSSIDLRKAFWQIPLEKTSCAKTAFCVPGKGLFEFVVMPFGLSNSPQSLQRVMERILGPVLLGEQVFVYLDDIIIASPTFESHINTLNEVARCLKEAGFTINLEKCQFCRSSLSFLGFVVDQQGLRTDPSKVSAILNFPTPRNTTEIKRVNGLISYYRRFIKDYARLSAPITSLLKGRGKGRTIQWTPEAENSFQEIKRRIATAPVLASPDFSKDFLIQTDASDVAVGAVLFQEFEGKEHPIAFASRTLTASERKYSATERELIGVIFGIEHFRGYVEGTSFCVITDCAALKWLNNLREPTGRLARWSMRLSQFTFSIKHRPGKQNIVPDALSRAIYLLDVKNLIPDEWYLDMLRRLQSNPDKFPNFRVQNNYLYKYMPSPYPIESNIPDWKLVIPTANRLQILQECHDEPSAAHFGVSKTLNRISELYYWPKLRQSVSKYIRNCKVCAAQKITCRSRCGFMGREKEISFPFQLVSMDLMGPFPKSLKGNRFLFVITDWFTKFVLVHPLREATTKPIIRFLKEQVFSIFGVPQVVLSDNGSQFISKEFTSFLDSLQVQKLWHTARYHPQINPTERVNRVIGTALASYIKENHREWDKHIFDIAQAIRSASHDVTGVPPNFLMFGRHVPLTGDFYGPTSSTDNLSISNRLYWSHELSHLPEFYENVKKRLHKAYQVNSKTYNLRKREFKFSEGDIVWKRNFSLSDASKYYSKKLAPKFVACRISKVISPLVYKLEDFEGRDLGEFHIKDLQENKCEF